jgi:hypothetical protein
MGHAPQRKTGPTICFIPATRRKVRRTGSCSPRSYHMWASDSWLLITRPRTHRAAPVLYTDIQFAALLAGQIGALGTTSVAGGHWRLFRTLGIYRRSPDATGQPAARWRDGGGNRICGARRSEYFSGVLDNCLRPAHSARRLLRSPQQKSFEHPVLCGISVSDEMNYAVFGISCS